MTNCEELINFLKDWFTPTEDLIDTIYPVGSIYMSVNTTNPSELFGGEWTPIEDTFLLASGETYENGTTGGSADAVVVTHTHAQNEHSHGMAHTHNHRHSMGSDWSDGSGSGGGYVHSSSRHLTTRYTAYDNTSSSKSNTDNRAATNQYTGVDGTGKNMPPYLAVNVWERTA